MKISRSCFVLVMFQSLKRDVAFFHYGSYRVLKYLFDVSIAQARFGLLPLPIEYGSKSGVHVVSIAQARCGLLPLGKNVAAEAMHKPQFQSLKRYVAFFHTKNYGLTTAGRSGFNRSSAMWPSSTGWVPLSRGVVW